MWEDEQDIEGLNQIQGEMDRDRIVVIQLEKQWVKDLGIYIEKYNDEYLYNLWINTEGYEMLDCDVITTKNRFFYEEILIRMCEMEDKIGESIKLLGSGAETEFVYGDDVVSVIQNSRNVAFWIVKDTLINDSIRSAYKERGMGWGMVALERVKDSINVKELISGIQKRPLMYVEEERLDYIFYLILGHVASNLMNGSNDKEDIKFNSFFERWLLGWVRRNVDKKYKLRDIWWWHHIIKDVTNSEKEATELFYRLCEEFFQEDLEKLELAAEEGKL